ncbi:glycoside hydrolase family 16 protein [Mycena maculata]|uniref:Glycoside hydrolase family 16 protein n=1 Tax=Mycena maculata TaxID=230809 RepID=A0AAD7HR73_9AGAR|nr:glycoside hydrolase family 16 protein [Mycena maculata]
MRSASLLPLLPVALQLRLATATYSPLYEYSGTTFFDKWDYYGNTDNETWGNVTFVAAVNFTKLTYTNAADNAILKVDNETTIAAAPLVYRDSVRITSKDAYPIGSVIVADFLHMPYGCGPPFGCWVQTSPGQMPEKLTSINLGQFNQMSLHTTDGCQQANNTGQVGTTTVGNCLDIAGTNINSSTSTPSLDLTDWGAPNAAYPASACNITRFFQPQQLVFDITVCGAWAGVPNIYAETCPGSCVRALALLSR